MQKRKANDTITANVVRDPLSQFTTGYAKVTKGYFLKTLIMVLSIMSVFAFLLFLL